MGKRVNWSDRAEAWMECAEHMEADWCDTKSERAEGMVVADFCLKMADKALIKVARAKANKEAP